MRNELVRAVFLHEGRPVLGRVHNVVFKNLIFRVQNASLIPSLQTEPWLLFLICELTKYMSG